MGESIRPVCGYDGLDEPAFDERGQARTTSACAVASSPASTASPTRTGRGSSSSGAGAGSPADGGVRRKSRDDAELR